MDFNKGALLTTSASLQFMKFANHGVLNNMQLTAGLNDVTPTGKSQNVLEIVAGRPSRFLFKF